MLFCKLPWVKWQLKRSDGQIAHFGKKCGDLPLFQKYIEIYQYLGTQIPQTQVSHGTMSS